MTSFSCRLRRVPYVVTYHNDYVGSGPGSYLYKAQQCLLDKQILLSASRLIGMSEDFIKTSDISDIFTLKSKGVEIIPNGVDIERFISGTNGVRVKSQYDTNGPVLLFVAALDKAHMYKGFELLLKALSIIIKNGKRVTLLVVGGGELKEQYINLTGSYGLTP